MEQVLYYLLPLTDPNCFKTVPWPITSFKEAVEFRNSATQIINVSIYLKNICIIKNVTRNNSFG